MRSVRLAIGGLGTIVLAAVQIHGLNSHSASTSNKLRSIHPRGSSSLAAPFGVQNRRKSQLVLRSVNNDGNETPNSKAKKKKKKTKQSKQSKAAKAPKQPKAASPSIDEQSKKKQEVMKELKARLEVKREKEGTKSDGGILGNLNPFQAGQNLRQTLGQITNLGAGLSAATKQKYYLDDRLLEKGGVLTERNPYLERLERDNFVPEVLVIGATGEVGRLVVRRLLLEGRFRVRVLVRDLYSQTLNLLGTGVTYCQGELGNPESLEYALTDVDKIVFCASAPRPDEAGFQEKFQYYMKENLVGEEANKEIGAEEESTNDAEWERLSSVLEVRASLAEQVDYIGMQNLVKAYQNVRHADYGTSQAAKRSLFKFSRSEDFYLFALDEDENSDANEDALVDSGPVSTSTDSGNDDDIVDSNEFDYYDDDEYDSDDSDEYYDQLYNVESRRDANVKSQVQWMRNEFGRGVFVGKVPKEIGSGVGGEAAIVSSRLRSREDPENGIDLSGAFAGFIVRLCGDGGNYEAFIRTGAYEEDGIEYVCDFMTSTKATSRENKSRNKYTTVRLAFEDFKPVRRKEGSGDEEDMLTSLFDGSDLRYIGFRYRSGSNKDRAKFQQGDFSSFYLALSYIKVYRQQPEPEFIYLSDARIPPQVRNGMVRHDRRELLAEDSLSSMDESDVVQLFDEATLATIAEQERSSEETYFKYRGEEVLKGSGLSYTILRVAGFNEVPSSEASSIDLRSSNDGVCPVSRAEVAQVCVSALLDPHALNKVVYMTKKSGRGFDEDMSAKFAALEM